MAGLRERRHEETKRALVDAAFELFTERGFGAVTMDEIAAAAGVSRSTAYRRFLTKEDLVLEVPRQWLAAFDDAFDALPANASLAVALRRCCMAVASFIDADPTTVLAAYRVLEEVPSLRSTGVATTAWLERMIGLVRALRDRRSRACWNHRWCSPGRDRRDDGALGRDERRIVRRRGNRPVAGATGEHPPLIVADPGLGGRRWRWTAVALLVAHLRPDSF